MKCALLASSDSSQAKRELQGIGFGGRAGEREVSFLQRCTFKILLARLPTLALNDRVFACLLRCSLIYCVFGNHSISRPGQYCCRWCFHFTFQPSASWQCSHLPPRTMGTVMSHVRIVLGHLCGWNIMPICSYPKKTSVNSLKI